MSEGNGVLKLLIQSRVFRRTLFVMFVLVLVIEGLFLYAVSQEYKKENLNALNEQAESAFMAIFLTHPYVMSDKMLLATAEMLLPGTRILGGVLYDEVGTITGRFGEPPAPVSIQRLSNMRGAEDGTGRLSMEGDRYDVLWQTIATGAPYTVHVRLNATDVQLKTEDFVARAVAVAVLLALVITLGAGFLITPTVFAPFARLRQNLGLTPHVANSAADEWQEVRDSVLSRGTPSRSIDPGLDERVKERTIVLQNEIARLKDAGGKLGRLAALTESASTPILRISQEGVILYANEPARELVHQWGATIGGPLSSPWADRISGFLERGVSGEIEETCGKRTYALTVVPAAARDAVDIYGYDVTERKRIDEGRQQTRQASQTGRSGQDVFAGINGRAALEERLAHALAMWHSTGEGGSLHLLEVHDFEQMSATVDHHTINDLMRDVMARLRTTVGAENDVIRLSRARFAIVRERTAGQSGSLAAAITLAETLLAAMAAPFHNDSQTIRVEASIGITLYPDDASDPEQLTRNGLMALEHAMGDGPNTLRFFIARLNEEVHKRHSLTADLRQALANDELTLHYQARLSLKTCRIAGAEALVRWPRHGEVLQPTDFIPMAESCDVGVALGRWVLNKACYQHKTWIDNGTPTITLSVNVSAALALSADLVDVVTGALRRSGLPPGLLELEFPEGLIMGNPDAFVAPMKALRDMGVKIAFDNFGTGYSSVEHISVLPINRIKIDPAFVSAVGVDAGAGRTIQAAAALAQGLNISVTAVGVETSEQVDFIQTMPIEEIQGFAFAKPMDAEAFQAFITNFTDATLSFPAANGRTRVGL